MVREVASRLVDADRETVFACLEGSSPLHPDGAVTSVKGERLDIRPADGATAEWFLLEDAPGGRTRVIHGASRPLRSLLDGVLLPEKLRRDLRRSLDDDLATLQRLAEEAARGARS